MSVDYASGLSPYEHKGECGMKEHFDSEQVVKEKVKQLADWIREERNLVVITGAGISTSAGIPDFRGPKGVWTLEQKGIKPTFDVTFDSARPTLTHMALVALEQHNILKHLISQNVDGLHLRSGYPRKRMSELHGNMFIEECDRCNAQYVRSTTVPTMAQQYTGNPCIQTKKRGSVCRGRLRDTILDWEGSLPDMDLDLADTTCRKASVCLTLGTSLQILPCGNMPLLTKKNGGKFCVVNLQPTKHDKKCHMKICGYVDMVMSQLCEHLGVPIPGWTRPTVNIEASHPTTHKLTFPPYVVDECLLPPKQKGNLNSESEIKTDVKVENEIKLDDNQKLDKKEVIISKNEAKSDVMDKVSDIKTESKNPSQQKATHSEHVISPHSSETSVNTVQSKTANSTSSIHTDDNPKEADSSVKNGSYSEGNKRSLLHVYDSDSNDLHSKEQKLA